MRLFTGTHATVDAHLSDFLVWFLLSNNGGRHGQVTFKFCPSKAKKKSESIHCQYVQWALQFAPFITYQKSATFQISTFKNCLRISIILHYSTKKPKNTHTHRSIWQLQIHLRLEILGVHDVTSPRPLNSGTALETDLIDRKSLRSHLHDCSKRSSPVIHLFFRNRKNSQTNLDEASWLIFFFTDTNTKEKPQHFYGDKMRT